MREIYGHQDATRVGFYKSMLEEAGIPCFIRNEISSRLLTGMPSPLFDPVLCVPNDEDYAEAMKILSAHEAVPVVQASDWKCPGCGEEVPGNFDSCWKCETARAT